jgi:hypothetical protein
LIEKIKCGIFRHGYKRTTMKQIDPHAKESYINKLKEKGLLIGCGKPFKINKNTLEIKKCGYI